MPYCIQASPPTQAARRSDRRLLQSASRPQYPHGRKLEDSSRRHTGSRHQRPECVEDQADFRAAKQPHLTNKILGGVPARDAVARIPAHLHTLEQVKAITDGNATKALRESTIATRSSLWSGIPSSCDYHCMGRTPLTSTTTGGPLVLRSIFSEMLRQARTQLLELPLKMRLSYEGPS